MLDALDDLEKVVSQEKHIWDHFFFKKEFECENIYALKWFNEDLNESQKEAVRFSLSSPSISLIHGPPGNIGNRASMKYQLN